MIQLGFWASAALITYTYALFPLLVFLRGRLAARPHHSADITPHATLIIAAHNEQSRIGPKLDSLRHVAYPENLLKIIVVSDGSTDRTVELVSSARVPNLTVVDMNRVGKAAALNAGVKRATGEILVFSDANSILDEQALLRLVRPFADPEVGGVAGNQVYVSDARGHGSAAGEKSFWKVDRALKRAQSLTGNTIAATGSLYAIRRELFQQVPSGVTDDLFISLSVIDAGRRLVFEPRAIAYEPAAKSSSLEYGRKVRIMTRGLRGVALRPRLFDPRRTGFYALDLLSRKVLMRTMAIPLAILALTNLRLVSKGHPYRLILAGQLGVYGLGVAGLALGRHPLGRQRALSLPAFFCLVQAASLHASWNVIRGRTYDRWEPERPLPRAMH